MDKLYIIEGIPGAGKTTLTGLLAERLGQCGQSVRLYREGDLNPADMAWSALLTREEHDEILKGNPSLRDEIIKNTAVWENKKIVAYTKIPNLCGELYEYFESKEIYDNLVDKETFCAIHEYRWKHFGSEAAGAGTTVFESVLLQNSVNELLLFKNADKNEITEYINRLLQGVRHLQPTIIYLQIDAAEAVSAAAAERVDEKGNRVWESRVTEYITNSPYGKKHGLSGVEGMTEYFIGRQGLELQTLKNLSAESIVLHTTLDERGADVGKLLESLCV